MVGETDEVKLKVEDVFCEVKLKVEDEVCGGLSVEDVCIIVVGRVLGTRTRAAGPASPALLTAQTLTVGGDRHNDGRVSDAVLRGDGTDNDMSTHELSLKLNVTL